MKNWQFWMLWLVLLFIALSNDYSMAAVVQSLNGIADAMNPVKRIEMFEQLLNGLQ